MPLTLASYFCFSLYHVGGGVGLQVGVYNVTVAAPGYVPVHCVVHIHDFHDRDDETPPQLEFELLKVYLS